MFRGKRTGKGMTMTLREREAASLVERYLSNCENARKLGIKLVTPREREIALLVERDLSNDEIARTLGITVGTVKFQVHNLKKRGLIPRLRRSASGASTAAGLERIREAQRRRWQRWRAARSDENT
jgi:DNA-binding CsgD family transcriptional regulator